MTIEILPSRRKLSKSDQELSHGQKKQLDPYPHHPPTTELPPRSKRKPRKKHRLRDRLLAATAVGGILFSAVHTANYELTKTLWPEKTTAGVIEITSQKSEEPLSNFSVGNKTITAKIGQRSETVKKHSGTFVLGGLGTEKSNNYAKAELPALKKYGRVFAVDFPTDMSKFAIATAINTTIQKDHLTHIILDGVSSGGIIELEILPLLDTKLYVSHTKINGHMQTDINDNVTIDHLIFDDTPIIPSDIKDQNYRLPVFLYTHGLQGGGGFLGKLIGQTYSHFWASPHSKNNAEQIASALKKFTFPFPPIVDDVIAQIDTHIFENIDVYPRNIPHQIRDTWNKTIDSIPPSLWITQLYKDSQNTMTQTVEALASKQYGSIIFLHPQNLSNDKVVKDKYAVQQLQWANHEAAVLRHKAKAKHLPVTLLPDPIVIPEFVNGELPGKVTHASAVQYASIYNKGLQAIFALDQVPHPIVNTPSP